MASPTWWTSVWLNSGSWWWTGRPGVLRLMGSERVGHDWTAELNWTKQAYYHNMIICSNSGSQLCRDNLLGSLKITDTLVLSKEILIYLVQSGLGIRMFAIYLANKQKRLYSPLLRYNWQIKLGYSVYSVMIWNIGTLWNDSHKVIHPSPHIIFVCLFFGENA